VVVDPDLIRGSFPHPQRYDAQSMAIDPGLVDMEWDRWTQSPQGRQEMARAQELGRVRAVGAKVGMSGGPPRPDPGVNQDIGQQDVPTMFDKPSQALDPYQVANPPYTEPNETGAGNLGPKRPQTSWQGSGLHAGAMAAQAREPFEQVGPAVPLHGVAPIAPAGPTPPALPSMAGQGVAEGTPGRDEAITASSPPESVGASPPPSKDPAPPRGGKK
jgi:hypothetical protein